MQIRVLGCSGSIAAQCRTTAFLLDDDILIDAGTGVGDLALDELERIDHILLTHSHLDHVLAVPLLADSVMRRRAQRPPIRVHALPETLATLREHLFNGLLWPDFTRLPSAERPVLSLQPLQVGQVIEFTHGRRIEVLPALHTVPAVGYAVLPGAGSSRGAWVYTGDTAPHEPLWQRLAQMQVDTLVIETAFRDDERALALVSRHLYPQAIGRELRHLAAGVAVYITHIKPGEIDTVMTELAALGAAHDLRALAAGQVLALD